jgi:hypothetical protein
MSPTSGSRGGIARYDGPTSPQESPTVVERYGRRVGPVVESDLGFPPKADPSGLDDEQVASNIRVLDGTERLQDALVHLGSR